MGSGDLSVPCMRSDTVRSAMSSQIPSVADFHLWVWMKFTKQFQNKSTSFLSRISHQCMKWLRFFLSYLFDFKTFERAWNWFQLSIYPKQKSHTQMQNAFETICALRATQTLRPGQICERKKSEMCVKHSCNYLQFSLFWWYLSSVHFIQNLNLVRMDAEFIL